MSNEHSNIPFPSIKKHAISVVPAFAVMLLFAVILAIVYLPNQPAPVNEDIVKARKERLAEVMAKQKEMLTGYVWLSKEEGITQIPIERAMQLTVRDLNKTQNKQ